MVVDSGFKITAISFFLQTIGFSKVKEMPAWDSPEAKALYVEYMQAKIADSDWIYGTALPKGFIPDAKSNTGH